MINVLRFLKLDRPSIRSMKLLDKLRDHNSVQHSSPSILLMQFSDRKRLRRLLRKTKHQEKAQTVSPPMSLLFGRNVRAA